MSPNQLDLSSAFAASVHFLPIGSITVEKFLT
jgi:hypothetical protein